MLEVTKTLSSFFIYAIIAVFAQNTVFSRALGVSRLIKLVDDSAVDSLTFGALLCAIQLMSASLAYFVNLLILKFEWLNSIKTYVRPLVMVLCAAVGFFVILGFIVLVFKLESAKNVVAVLPMATFNCCIIGTLLITTTQNFTLMQTMGFAFGSGVGYILAVLVVTEGQRKIQNRTVPATLKGLPITLIYIGILALAIYGFTGHMPTF